MASKSWDYPVYRQLLVPPSLFPVRINPRGDVIVMHCEKVPVLLELILISKLLLMIAVPFSENPGFSAEPKALVDVARLESFAIFRKSTVDALFSRRGVHRLLVPFSGYSWLLITPVLETSIRQFIE